MPTYNGGTLGRPKGARNKATRPDVWAMALERDENPLSTIFDIAGGNLRCGVCRGELTMRYPVKDENDGFVRDEDGQLVIRSEVCRSCVGTGWEKLKPETVLNAAEWLGDKLVPSLKQVEHIGDNGAERPVYQVVVVQPPAVQPGAAQGQILQAKAEGMGD